MNKIIYTGKLKKYFKEKGYGFIESDNFNEDIFVHGSNLQGKWEKMLGIDSCFYIRNNSRTGKREALNVISVADYLQKCNSSGAIEFIENAKYTSLYNIMYYIKFYMSYDVFTSIIDSLQKKLSLDFFLELILNKFLPLQLIEHDEVVSYIENTLQQIYISTNYMINIDYSPTNWRSLYRYESYLPFSWEDFMTKEDNHNVFPFHLYLYLLASTSKNGVKTLYTETYFVNQIIKRNLDPRLFKALIPEDKLNTAIYTLKHRDDTPSEVSSFKNKVAIYNRNGKWGFLDENFNEIISINYEKITYVKNGMYVVVSNGKKGIIDSIGNIILEPVHDLITPWSDSLYCVISENKKGYIDKKGNFIVPLRYYEYDNEEQITVLENTYYVRNNSKYTFYKAYSEKEIAEHNLDCLHVYNSHGVTQAVLNSKKEVIIDQCGNFLSDPYDILSPQCGGEYYCVLRDNKWGVIDKLGSPYIPIVFSNLRRLTYSRLSLGEYYDQDDYYSPVVEVDYKGRIGKLDLEKRTFTSNGFVHRF